MRLLAGEGVGGLGFGFRPGGCGGLGGVRGHGLPPTAGVRELAPGERCGTDTCPPVPAGGRSPDGAEGGGKSGECSHRAAGARMDYGPCDGARSPRRPTGPVPAPGHGPAPKQARVGAVAGPGAGRTGHVTESGAGPGAGWEVVPGPVVGRRSGWGHAGECQT
ncbi:hypothetical protein GCM10010347_09930 [Streptomyces cirratus]|uniref:Uncharacterized protein n=1 Tax=Streptomyces cirratus TaxID=68187 RepID=A0ABQ3ENI5_9ACTN|nr:hypothetical protein GCM10010347_09930 [Streptomyces cirratus]